MTKQSLSCEIGFSDAELESYTKQGTNLIVCLSAWSQKQIELRFENAVRVLDFGIGDISDVCMKTEQTELLASTLKQIFERVPEDHPYREYHFLNLDDSIGLAIIAEAVTIRVL